MNRLTELDILRGLAILGVLGIHIMVHCKGYLPEEAVGWSYFYAMVCLLGRIGVPSFIIISGFFLTRNELTGKRIGTTVFRRVCRILPPYLFWSCIYFLWTYPYLFTWETGRHPGVIFVEKLLTGTVSWHLYFIFLLLQYYVFCAFGFGRGGKIRRGEFTVVCGLQVLFLMMCYLAAYHEYFMVKIPVVENIFYYFNSYRLSFFPMYIGYFLFGRWLGANYEWFVGKCRKFRMVTFVGMLLGLGGAIVEVGYVGYLSGKPIGLPADWLVGTNIFVVSALGYILPYLIVLKEKKKGAGLQRLAGVSFVLYLLHEPLMGYCTASIHKVLSGIYVWEFVLPVASVLATSIIALLFYSIVSKIAPVKIAKMMFG